MSEQPTCGQGIAAHSALHAKIADFIEAVGKNLELHLTSLDPKDAHSKPEVDAYTSLVKQHRDLTARLRATADEMASYRDLPMANHDMEILSGRPVAEAFRDLVVRQEELLAMLQSSAAEYRAMLEDEADA